MSDPRIEEGFCRFSQDLETGGHSAGWEYGEPCRWCSHQRQLRPPDLEITPDLEVNPWAQLRDGGSGEVRRVGLFRHPDRGRLVAILVRLADGSDVVGYATVDAAIAVVDRLRRTPIVGEERRRRRTRRPGFMHVTTLYVLIGLMAAAVVILIKGHL